jgi:hypothetical protein
MIRLQPCSHQKCGLWPHLVGNNRVLVAQPACAHIVSLEERCKVLACFHVVVKMYRYLEERVFIVKTYWITGSIKNCQRRFVEQFGGWNLPSKCCIWLLVKKLETKGTLLELHGGGRPEMSENTVHDVANRLLASPRKSLRVLSQVIELSRSTCQRAAKKSLPACLPV